MQMEPGDKRNTSKLVRCILAGTHFLHVEVAMVFLNGVWRRKLISNACIDEQLQITLTDLSTRSVVERYSDK